MEVVQNSRRIFIYICKLNFIRWKNSRYDFVFEKTMDIVKKKKLKKIFLYKKINKKMDDDDMTMSRKGCIFIFNKCKLFCFFN